MTLSCGISFYVTLQSNELLLLVYNGIQLFSSIELLSFTSVAKVHIEADQIQAAETNDCVDDPGKP